MYKSLILAAILCTAEISTAPAQVDLSTYADGNGLINVQKLTCAQLAGTWQGDADMLTTWYSGWHNGLARKHYLDIRKGKEAEHEVIVYCKANPDQLIIEAIAVVFKDMRARLGTEMSPRI
jgi:HdeA/HdeB family